MVARATTSGFGSRTRRRSPASSTPLQPGQPLQREGWLRERSDRQAHERQRVVVAGDAIEVHGVASAAAMDERPFAVVANADRDRRHRGGAVRAAVAGHVVVEVLAPQAVGAVVAVLGARRIQRYVEPAVTASERARATPPGTGALIARQGDLRERA